MKGKMNIDFEEVYEQESDIYYVSFRTGEPSYAIELDDVLLLEVGMFTSMPTGFRILNFKKHSVGTVKILVKKVQKTVEEAKKEIMNRFSDRGNMVTRNLEKVLA